MQLDVKTKPKSPFIKWKYIKCFSLKKNQKEKQETKKDTS
jgi:hypothetical protein